MPKAIACGLEEEAKNFGPSLSVALFLVRSLSHTTAVTSSLTTIGTAAALMVWTGFGVSRFLEPRKNLSLLVFIKGNYRWGV